MTVTSTVNRAIARMQVAGATELADQIKAKILPHAEKADVAHSIRDRESFERHFDRAMSLLDSVAVNRMMADE